MISSLCVCVCEFLDVYGLISKLWEIPSVLYIFLEFLKKIYLFLERGEGRKKERETSVCGCLSAPPTGDLACNPGMCPDWELNQ